MSAFADDRPKEAHTLKELAGKGYKLKQGEWRMALAVAAERIMGERNDDGSEKRADNPLPKNPVWRAAYIFLKQCEKGDVNYIKELANRLDGLPSQAISVEDKRSLEELSDAELAAASEALTAILAAKNSAAGASAAGEAE